MLPARWVAVLRTEAVTALAPPSEAAGEARARIRLAAMLGLGAYALFLVVEWIGVMGGSTLERRIDLAHDVIALALCAALFLSTLGRTLADDHVVRCAMVFEFLLCAVISLAVPWAGWLRTGHLPGITWVVPIVIGFALLLPVPPRTQAIVSAMSALTMPAGLALLASTGRVTARTGDYWAAALASLVGMAIAAATARSMHGARLATAAAHRMGGYELLEQLGKGGMGEVWRARHLLLARPAAVKLVLAERLALPMAQRESLLARFTREAQVTAALRSPHTVELFDFGASVDGTMYYAMELLDGMNLEHFVYRHGPVEPRRAVHWLRQVCHSLGEAHARELTHRDIKPANLMVCVHGREHDFVKVLDFGLARAVAPTGEPSLTREGGWLGSPAYMAPEQWFGQTAGPRSDLYALGCVGYWLLAGVRPFDSDESGELMRQHLQVEPAPLSESAAQPIPAALEQAIMSCLAKDPEHRPRDADELAERLAHSVPGEPWSEPEARAWWARAHDGT